MIIFLLHSAGKAQLFIRVAGLYWFPRLLQFAFGEGKTHVHKSRLNQLFEVR